MAINFFVFNLNDKKVNRVQQSVLYRASFTKLLHDFSTAKKKFIFQGFIHHTDVAVKFFLAIYTGIDVRNIKFLKLFSNKIKYKELMEILGLVFCCIKFYLNFAQWLRKSV